MVHLLTASSGKSSLVLLLLGFLDPADHGGLQGTVSVDGISLSDLDPQRLREQIITIPQDTVFLPPGSTVAQNLDPLGVSTAEQCRGVLVDLDLWRTVELQGGLDSPLAEGELSQGQRQMFSLARAVVRRRSLAEEGGGAVLLVDEFTSSVDVGTERRMMAAVEKEFRGCTVVMVAHRLDMVTEVCDRVFVVDHGRIAESGDPRVLGRMEGTWFASLLEAST